MNARIFSFSSFIIFLMLSSILPAQNISFRDSFLKEYLLISSPYNAIARNGLGNAIKIDSNGDGEISKEEALEVYSLVLSLESLLIPAERPDTRWIKNFTNLRSLTCYGSPYAKIKFDISELTQLTELYQYKVTMLYGQQPNLKILFTDQFPEHLTSEHLSFAPNLEILQCGDNQKSVTLTKLPALKELHLEGKNLSRIKLADLSALSLFHYSAKDDKNPSLYLENLPQITQLQLPTDSGIDSLVVKNLPNLRSLDIQVKSQQLMNVKNLVLEGLPQLASLTFTNRNATSQPEAPTTLAAISQETGLQEETLPNITDEKTEKIAVQIPAQSPENTPSKAIASTKSLSSVTPEPTFDPTPQKNISQLIEIDEIPTESLAKAPEVLTNPESLKETEPTTSAETQLAELLLDQEKELLISTAEKNVELPPVDKIQNDSFSEVFITVRNEEHKGKSNTEIQNSSVQKIILPEPENSEKIADSTDEIHVTDTFSNQEKELLTSTAEKNTELPPVDKIKDDSFSELLIPEKPVEQKVTMHTETKSDSSIIIHPNIVMDTLFINKNIAPAPFEIFDINDIKVLSGIFTNERAITLEALYEGEYTLVIYTSNGKIKESFIKN
ncbi:T9SS type A sorting domain-containing protein [Apibacter raozihei]|uniref:T9SS type A sorting domain-containing protein n=1 Tax=Apibacter raozihei TaxID=2500547 RepID=UPI000FE3AD0F|nr:T9SS type A sorting domain-containing protein [Apibacter raozihei]